MKRGNISEKLKKKMDISEGIEYKPLCKEELSRIFDIDILQDRKIQSYDLINANKINIHIRGYMDYYGGYAEHTRNVVYRLDELGDYNIKVTNIKTPVDVDPITWQKNNWYIHNKIDLDKSLFMCIAGVGWLQNKFLPVNRKVIAWTMIESMDWSKECVEWLNNTDIVLCPTMIDFYRAERALGNTDKLVLMKLGFDNEKFNPDIKRICYNNISDSKFIFGFLGSWNVRKGVKDIIKAYCKAFDKNDNVCLLMVSKYGNRPFGIYKDNKEMWTIEYEFKQILKEINKSYEKLPQISIIDIPIHENIIPNIMQSFNCLVGFSSGESTWLPGLQAIGMKIPIIQLHNECCGYLDYLDDTTAFMCEKVEYKVCDEWFWKTTSEYYENQIFGFGDYNELADKMVQVYEEYMGIRTLNKIMNAYEISRKWTWDESIYNLDKFLREYNEK